MILTTNNVKYNTTAVLVLYKLYTPLNYSHYSRNISTGIGRQLMAKAARTLFMEENSDGENV